MTTVRVRIGQILVLAATAAMMTSPVHGGRFECSVAGQVNCMGICEQKRAGCEHIGGFIDDDDCSWECVVTGSGEECVDSHISCII